MQGAYQPFIDYSPVVYPPFVVYCDGTYGCMLCGSVVSVLQVHEIKFDSVKYDSRNNIHAQKSQVEKTHLMFFSFLAGVSKVMDGGENGELCLSLRCGREKRRSERNQRKAKRKKEKKRKKERNKREKGEEE